MKKKEIEKMFENLTIGQLRKLTVEFLKTQPDFKTAEELLNEKLK